MIHEGLITESFPNGMLPESVYILYNEDLILGYISGKIRRSLIQTLPVPGDRIKIKKGNIIHSTRGRIIYRLRNKDSND